MLTTIRNAWKIPELRKKILFTIFALLIFRLGSAVPVPYIDSTTLETYLAAQSGTILGLMNAMSGSAFSMATLFALSIQPYINSSIIIQLLTVAIPALERLAQEGRIPTTFGQTLSWEYLRYVRTHPARRWRTPTAILYGARDHLTDRETVEAFAARNGCRLTVEEAGEHWFHTPEQLAVVDRWQRACLADLE